MKKKRPATSPSRTLMSPNFLGESYTQQLGSGRGGDNGEDPGRTGSSEMTIRPAEFGRNRCKRDQNGATSSSGWDATEGEEVSFKFWFAAIDPAARLNGFTGPCVNIQHFNTIWRRSHPFTPAAPGSPAVPGLDLLWKGPVLGSSIFDSQTEATTCSFVQCVF